MAFWEFPVIKYRSYIIVVISKFLRQNRTHIILLLAGLVICILCVSYWFSGNSYLNYVDALVPVDTKNSFLRLFYIFNSHVFPWNTETNWSWAPYWAILSAGHELFNSLSLGQELLYIVLLFASIANFYFLTNYLFKIVVKKSNMVIVASISFVFALFYTFNLYTFYYAFFMFNPDAFIIAFLPLNILALFKLYPLNGGKAESRTRWIVTFFVTLILMTSGFITYIFLAQYLVWISFYLTIYVFLQRKRMSLKRIASIAVFLILILLSQWWWFLPALLGFADLYAFQSSTGILSWFNGGFLPSQLLNSLRILGIPLMSGNPFSWSYFYTDNKLFTFPLFLLPFLLLFFVYKLKSIKYKSTFVYLLIMLAVSLFIVKFSNPPAAFIAGFAYVHIPFFGAFRDSYHKAGVYYLFPFMALASLGAGLILQNIWKKQNKIFFVVFLAAIAIAGVVITGPFFLFNGDNIRNYTFYSNNKEYSISAKTKIPPEYYQLKNVFEPMCSGKVVLVVPRGAWISSAVWSKYGTSYMSLDLLSQILNCTFVNNVAFNTQAEAVDEAPYVLLQNDEYSDFKQFLYKNQIQFILLRNDNVPNSFTNWLYIDPKTMEAKLDADPDFEKENINNYFTVYKLKSLDFPNTFGFALSAQAAYTNSPFENAIDDIVMSRMTPNIVGLAILNTQKELSLFANTVRTYIAEGICSSCRAKDEMGRLTAGAGQALNFKLEVAKDGIYNCSAHVYTQGSDISQVLIIDSKKQVTDITNSQQVSLSKGIYTADVSYSIQKFVNEESVSIHAGDTFEIPVPRLTDRNYRLSYLVTNPNLSLEVILANKSLSNFELSQKQINPEDVVFTDPFGPANSQQISDRIFQLDEFNIKDYHLYVRVSTDNSLKHSVATLKNLVLERAVDTNYITFACTTQTDNNLDDLTSLLKVQEANPLEYKIILPKNFENGFLAFNKSFASSWQAYVMQNGKKQVLPHVQSGYANAWYIGNINSREVIVTDTKQSFAEDNAIAIFIIFPIILFLYIKFKND